ncbi:MAG: hypothetical protein QGH42_05115 [Kiritimatiellia bacterium]|jgi:hypothetical protein|nr:hypothetical protein [Kiritimatiellia bacterium]MDP6629974.1 hypothetical protein [Kiritimatiellia bacterium]MDP6810172.1 hypothetical protein [Kiritimatiellia bacterium]MDP7023610.1 hypothetical protein [Kiritimatiellia bacterium]
MTNAERILGCLDRHLSSHVELTLYGRAALTLGYSETPEDYALSHDVDAVLWMGQAEELNESTNFWKAVAASNDDLGDAGLYISHFFTEDQVILLPDWKSNRVMLPDRWSQLTLYRLSDLDLLLSKLMRDDAIDQSDARFIIGKASLDRIAIEQAITRANVPESPEVREQFAIASRRLLDAL